MRTTLIQRSREEQLQDLDIETPAFVYDELTLADDLSATRAALAPTGARLLLAMKAFSFEPGLRFAAPWLDGLHASSAFEARLARRVLEGGIVHTTAPGLRPQDLGDVVRFSDRVSFNSLGQWRRSRSVIGGASPGLRINPGLSFVEDERYDPAARNSKLGMPIDHVVSVLRNSPSELDEFEGILVHNNCESVDFEELLRVVERLIDRLDPLLRRLKWINLGGGYLFLDAEDLAPLHDAVKLLTGSYGVEVLFEPGTSLVYRAGSIVTTVVDLFESGGREVAVLDTSVSHVPEVLEYQYVPEIAGPDGCHRYVLDGASCLAGDTFGHHCLATKLDVGSRVVITDVGAYSLVKASWFNGIALPTVYSRSADGILTRRMSFGFEDFLRFSGGSSADN